MTIVVLDNFTGTNGDSLDAHTPDTRPGSNAWTERVGNWEIQSNRATVAVGINAAIATIDSGEADGIVTAVGRMNSTSTSTGRLTGAVVRWQSAGNYWACGFLIGTNTLYIVQFSGGTPTTRASDNTLSLSADTFYTVEVTLSGNDITVTLDGGHSITYNSSTGATSTEHGVTLRDPTAYIDSFSVDDGVSGPTYTLTADAGSFTLTGNDANLVASRLLTASVGTFVLTGIDANLVYTPIGGPTYTLTAESGTFVLSGIAANLVLGSIVTYTDGYGGDVNTAQDVMLVSGAPTIAFSTHDVYDVSTSRVFLQRFILNGIQAGTACVKATLHYFKTSAVPNSEVTCTVYKISDANGDWTEGPTYGGLAVAGEPCWNAKEADGAGGVTTAWAGSAGLGTSGTDYDATPLGSFVIGASASVGTEYTCEIDPAVVATWFGQATNNGILLKANGAAEYIGSSEHATTGYRPFLVVEVFESATTYTLVAETGTFTLSGIASNLLAARQLSSEVGSFVLTGQDAGLLASRLLTADAGAFVLTGLDAGLFANRLLTAGLGTFVLTGIDANLVYTPLGGPTYTLSAESGIFTLVGIMTDLLAGRLITAGTGVFTLTGVGARLVYSADQSIPVSRTYAISAETRILDVTTEARVMEVQ